MTSLRRYPNSNRTTANIPVDSRKAFSRGAVPHVSTNTLCWMICMEGIEGAIAPFTHPNKPSQFITQ